jgi:glycosyltransferase involved in cell wall biosynthesis
MSRAVYLTGIPVPYRDPVHRIVSALLGGDYHVLYAHEYAPYSQTRGLEYPHTFLARHAVPFRGRHIYANWSVWRELDRLDPAVVITTGFSPTFLAAVAWCSWRRRRHIPFQDGWLGSELGLTAAHRIARRWVIKHSHAFLVPSQKSRAFFWHYGVDDERIFTSPLCANNAAFAPYVGAPAEYDIMYSSRFVDLKQPLFFARVASRLSQRRPKVRALLLGKGPLVAATERELRRGGVDYHYAGFASQDELPRLYSSARVLLFPTRAETWGVVANEACAAGVPVVTTPGAGCADELVIHGKTGIVMPTVEDAWVDAVDGLLSDEPRRGAMGRAAAEHVQTYNYQSAADGIVAAVTASTAR